MCAPEEDTGSGCNRVFTSTVLIALLVHSQLDFHNKYAACSKPKLSACDAMVISAHNEEGGGSQGQVDIMVMVSARRIGRMRTGQLPPKTVRKSKKAEGNFEN